MTLIDSGADESLIYVSLAAKLELSLQPLHSTLVARSFNGRSWQMLPMYMPLYPCLLLAVIMNVFSSISLITPHAPVVLCIPWLKKHNPHIDWVNNKIGAWSPIFWSLSLKLWQKDFLSYRLPT